MMKLISPLAAWCHFHDLHATVLHLLGLDYTRLNVPVQ
jgi:hypothetical protein